MMRILAELVERLRALIFSARQDREMDDELQFHIERDIEERVRAGADPVAARRAALIALGGVENVKENVRDARGVRPLRDLTADLRFALRSLRRDPIYLAAAVLVLGVGIGAGTAVFTVANGVLFSPLPYPDSERLVRVGQLYQSQSTVWQLSTVDFQAIREQQRSFEAFGAVNWNSAALSRAGTPEEIAVGRVTGGFFQALGISPLAGRLIGPGDEEPEAPAVVVLSHRLAERRFGSPGAALGQPVTLDGVSHTVVGVLPPGMDVLGPGVRADAWPGLRLQPPTRRGPFWLRGVGRLREGVSLEAAARDMAAIGERIFPIWASSFQDQTARITPMLLRDTIVGTAARSVGLFGAAVALVLLVAIVNVTTLSLVRASAREQELAVRVALGAGRLRLARLPLTEGLLVGIMGGVFGVGIAAVGLRLLPHLAPRLPRIQEVGLDLQTIGFAALVALASGLLVSISPVLVATRAATGPSTRTDTRRTGADKRTTTLRSALVVTEFALALPLLLGASLLFRSFVNLQRVDLGFDPTGVLSVSVALPGARYPDNSDVQRFWRELESRASETPGLAAVGIASDLPPAQVWNINNFNLIDRPVDPGVAEHLAPWLFVTPGYFDALDIPLLNGRMFTEADSGQVAPVVLVSRWWAERYYPGESAVGRQMVQGGCTTCPPTTVIGVVGDVKYAGLSESGNAVYSPLAQTSQSRSAHLVARTRNTPASAFRDLRRVVASLDGELPVEEQTSAQLLERALSAPSRATAVLGSFAGAAVLLAALGIFGLMSYVVRQRRREIGVRIALGADPHSIARMIVGRGMRYAAVGTAIGLVLTLLEARWLAAFLYGVAATDPLTMGAVVVGLLVVAVFACWFPALRAAQIHPVEAIATE